MLQDLSGVFDHFGALGIKGLKPFFRSFADVL